MSDPVQSEALQDRLDRLQELTEFTETCQKRLKELFETLGWSQEDDEDLNQEPMEQCPYDSNHVVPVRTLEKHKSSCMLRRMGYSAEEQEEMCDPSVCYENRNIKTFLMDKSTQHQVILQARSAAPLMKMEGVFWQGQYSGQPVDVPQNHKRAVCDLTVADRLALYDHVVGVLGQQSETASSNEDLYVDLVSKLKKDEQQNEPKSHLELMAEMRDYKRRRQSYRAKNVHITKKSYTELQYGDIIAKTRGSRFTYKHYGIYLDRKRFEGQKADDNIFHFTGFHRNAILGGCIFDKVDIKHYEKDNYLDKIESYKNKVSTEEITKRIEEKYKSCGKDPKTDIWEAFSNNCEHLANYIRYGEKISLQLGQKSEVLVLNPKKTKEEINQIKQQLKISEVPCDDACKKQGTEILKEDRDDENSANTNIG